MSCGSTHDWKFCPLCGTQWEGFIPEKERIYPPYRKETRGWLLEVRRNNVWREDAEKPEWGPWQVERAYDVKCPATKALEELRSRRYWAKKDHGENSLWEPDQYRVRIGEIPNHITVFRNYGG